MNRTRFAAVALGLSVLAGPRITESQIVKPSDPCYTTLSESGNLILLTQVMLSDANGLGGALVAIDGWTAASLQAVQRRGEEIADGKTLTPEEVQQRRRIRDCLDWLRDITGRVDKEAASSGINLIEPNSPRGQRLTPVDRVAFVREIVARIGALHSEITVQIGRREGSTR